jgi:hypothetical protein
MKLTRRTCMRPTADAAAVAAMSRLARAQLCGDESLRNQLGALSCLRAEALGRPLTRDPLAAPTLAARPARAQLAASLTRLRYGLRASSGIWV